MNRLYLPEWGASIRWNAIVNGKEPMIYLSGVSMSSVRSFLPVASNQLLKDTTGILLDYFGAGFSDHPIKFPYTLEALAGTIIQVIEHKGCSSCHFVGASFGGRLAIIVAFHRPEM